jgi:hypothetical protein
LEAAAKANEQYADATEAMTASLTPKKARKRRQAKQAAKKRKAKK